MIQVRIKKKYTDSEVKAAAEEENLTVGEYINKLLGAALKRRRKKILKAQKELK